MRIKDILYLFLFGSCVNSMVLESNETVSLTRRRRSLGFKTVCYPGLGCFYTGPPFKNIPNRIISLPPLPQEVIRTIYLLFTPKNSNNPLSFSPEKHDLLLKSNFNTSSWTRIIIHGYVDGTYASTWPFEMKDEFLRNSDDNVIALDHATTLLFPRIIYMQSVADTRVIGVQVANLITFLHEKLGADLKKIHLIGHSLGAMIAGYAGERLPNLGRITGLDPAGPYFRNVANNVKLDTSDATFVDVIHSNPSAVIGFGTNEDLGHINFWPNGGKQRGCPLTLLRTLVNGILPFELQTVATCPHRRSIDFFVFSFNQNDCLIVGVECTSWIDFLQGKCNCGLDGQMCSLLGVFAKPKPPPRRRYYLKTAGERPFCLHQYQVIVYLKTVGNATKFLNVPIQIIIAGDNHFVKEELLVNIDLSIPKQINTFLVTSFQRIGKIQTVEVSTFENLVDVNTNVMAVEVNYLYPKLKNISEARFCRPPVLKEDSLKKNILFSSHHCHSYQ